MLCFGCGNEIEDGAATCPVCSAKQDPRRDAGTTCPDCGAEEAACTCRPRRRETLCPQCGNTIVAGTECLVCAAARNRKRAARSAEDRHLCLSCGNEIFGSEPCPICTSGRAFRKKKATLCRRCGNEILDGEECGICRAGRAPHRRRRADAGPTCPLCEEGLVEQDWDGAPVMLCESCNGCFFLDGGLEQTLDKLRADAEPASLAQVLGEFRDRYTRSIPNSVRYKPCPICATSMVRRNYAGVSGIIIDVCGRHGTWTDQSAFGELTDFVSRGGDLLAKNRRRR